MVAPKNKDKITWKSGVTFRFRCAQADCKEEYIGESGRTFGNRLKEHLRAPFPIYDHVNASGHGINVDNFSIVDKDAHSTARTIKEAMFIRFNDPTLNGNLGKFQLSHIRDEVLQDTPAFHHR